jgi:hypothetical protein
LVAPNPERENAIADIAAHLAQHGPGDWKKIRDRYPAVSDAAFWRYVKEARRRPAPQPFIEAARRVLAERAAAMTHDEKIGAITANLPAAVSPDFIARNGERGQAQLRLIDRFEQLFDDAILLRAFAMHEDGRRIKNPVIFGSTISMRDGLLRTALQATQAIWDLRRSQELWDLAMDEIAAESPECVGRILVRLTELNSRAGFTDARV